MREVLDESHFIQVYRELMGTGEAQARSAFMFACSAEAAAGDGEVEPATDFVPDTQWEEEKLYEPVTEPRSLSHLHQLPGTTRGRFA